MKETKEIPTTTDVAGWMALRVGLIWSVSFLCTMYGTERPLLSTLSTALGLISIYALYKQLKNYRNLYSTINWWHILRLSFTTCLLAGLLTDAAQYVYFLWFDNGRLLSLLASTMQSQEYREAWQKMLPETNLNEIQEIIQTMTVRDIMQQLVLYNVLLALPVSLLAAIPVKAPAPSKGL